ncbi:hypothetical protein [Bifidobacterium simiarum]|uniref:hypothetical protein n=1 Tax=Bifidobacterium simiarum TaxID=2045441 RepID=UPI001BDC1A98|nr:hypothetical protein [Bifidobacterium simiarum]MBT1165994.1 hypothetical protein [Bifidobacterium simiarum]
MTKASGEAGSDRSLGDVFEAFERVRGDHHDRIWAERVAWSLLDEHHGQVDAVRSALERALDELRMMLGDDGGTPLAELFGEPREWAAYEVEEWREDGLDRFGVEPPPSLRDVVVHGFGFAAPLSLLFWIVLVLAIRDWHVPGMVGRAFVPSPTLITPDDVMLSTGTVGKASGLIAWPMVVVPWLLTVTALMGNRIYRLVLAARSAVGAAIAAVAVGLLGVVLLVAVMWSATGGPYVPTAWMLAMTVIYGIAAYVISCVWKEEASKGFDAGGDGIAGTSYDSTADDLLLNDDEWLARVAALLRARNDMTDADVRRICDDARNHAGESGATLVEEFGTPGEYASRFAPTPIKARRELWYWVFAAVLAVANILWVVFTGGAVSGAQIGQLICFDVAVILAYRGWRGRRCARRRD